MPSSAIFADFDVAVDKVDGTKRRRGSAMFDTNRPGTVMYCTGVRSRQSGMGETLRSWTRTVEPMGTMSDKNREAAGDGEVGNAPVRKELQVPRRPRILDLSGFCLVDG